MTHLSYADAAKMAPGVAGRHFCITGVLLVARANAQDMIQRYGGYADNAVRKGTTDYLVIGKKPGNTKLSAMHRFYTKTLTEAQFWSLFPPGARPYGANSLIGFESSVAVVTGKEPEKMQEMVQATPSYIRLIDI